MTQIC